MRREGWTYWETGLPADSEALAALDDLARSLHVSRGEANRLLLIAYAKAQRGEWGQLWGFGASCTPVLSHSGNAAAASERVKTEEEARRKRGRVAAAALLDDD